MFQITLLGISGGRMYEKVVYETYTEKNKDGSKGWCQVALYDETQDAKEYPYLFIKEPNKEPIFLHGIRCTDRECDTVESNDNTCCFSHEDLLVRNKLINPRYMMNPAKFSARQKEGFRVIDPKHMEMGIVFFDQGEIIFHLRMKIVNEAEKTELEQDEEFIRKAFMQELLENKTQSQMKKALLQRSFFTKDR